MRELDPHHAELYLPLTRNFPVSRSWGCADDKMVILKWGGGKNGPDLAKWGLEKPADLYLASFGSHGFGHGIDTTDMPVLDPRTQNWGVCRVRHIKSDILRYVYSLVCGALRRICIDADPVTFENKANFVHEDFDFKAGKKQNVYAKYHDLGRKHCTTRSQLFNRAQERGVNRTQFQTICPSKQQWPRLGSSKNGVCRASANLGKDVQGCPRMFRAPRPPWNSLRYIGTSHKYFGTISDPTSTVCSETAL